MRYLVLAYTSQSQFPKSWICKRYFNTQFTTFLSYLPFEQLGPGVIFGAYEMGTGSRDSIGSRRLVNASVNSASISVSAVYIVSECLILIHALLYLYLNTMNAHRQVCSVGIILSTDRNQISSATNHPHLEFYPSCSTKAILNWDHPQPGPFLTGTIFN